MAPIRFLAVITILIGATCANAGVIVQHEGGVAVSPSSNSKSELSDWVVSSNDDSTNHYFVNSDGDDDLGGVAATVVQSGGHALSCSCLVDLAMPKLSGTLAFANSVLPDCPLSDGILKPS
ncbi:secreted protein [Rhodopirellula sallentina SM41]|uniref:Secreted protein n=1 Tax=Rhodopirellula sallentina SM41 TaxID=1263870 RepID=M5UB88_9BACT|nr:secreted protein [Rhodopirellula sallentina SM41]